MGWRHWNQWNGAISQEIIEGNMIILAARNRTINGKLASLADVGYSDAGIDGASNCVKFVLPLFTIPSKLHVRRLAKVWLLRP